MQDVVTFTVTSTLRPSVLAETFRSFNDNIRNISLKKTKAIINIDPVPANYSNEITKIRKICLDTFCDVNFREAVTPNFCEAVRWCWSQCTTPYVFHIEDDWALLRPLKIRKLIEIFDKNPELVQIRLRKKTSERGMRLYGLSPCLMRNSFCQKLVNSYDISKNPEKQLLETDRLGIRPPSEKTLLSFPISKKKLKDREAAPSDLVIIRDIGRNWRIDRSVSKPPKGEEIKFLTWTYGEFIR